MVKEGYSRGAYDEAEQGLREANSEISKVEAKEFAEGKSGPVQNFLRAVNEMLGTLTGIGEGGSRTEALFKGAGSIAKMINLKDAARDEATELNAIHDKLRELANQGVEGAQETLKKFEDANLK